MTGLITLNTQTLTVIEHKIIKAMLKMTSDLAADENGLTNNVRKIGLCM